MKECVFCGKLFEPGENRGDGFPTGVEVDTHDGKTNESVGKAAICDDCLIELIKALNDDGILKHEDKEKFKKWL